MYPYSVNTTFRSARRYMLPLLAAGVSCLLGVAAFGTPPTAKPDRPNILWITCEDMSFHLGSYGSHQVKTPNLDGLAAAGTRYTHAFATAGVCAPSRSAIITGMYQQSIGTHHMRTGTFTHPPGDAYPAGYKGYSAVLPEGVKCFPEYLRAAGYYCTNNVKQDYQFEAPPTVWDENSKEAHWRGRKDKSQPFFSVFNFIVTHESQVWARANEPLLVQPEDVIVPPYYPDVPAVRQDLARHLSNVMVMDGQVGEVLRQLREDGLEDNTIIFFYSDHGDGLPFVKRELYDRGVRVPFLIRFARNFPALDPYQRAGAVDDQLISFVDLAPTVLSLAGIPVPAHMQGQAFLGPQRAAAPRTHVFAARDRIDSEYDRVRMARDRQYLYVRNYMPEKPLYQHIRYRLQQPMMQAILQLKEEGKLNETQMRWFRPDKPAEELYDCQADPHQFRNLAGEPAHAARLAELRGLYDAWIERVGDLGAVPEPDMVSRWWGGKPAAPATETPQVKRQKDRLAVACGTAGASIGYKRRWADAWQVYTGPVPVGPGDSLYVVAQRIGYTRSPVVAQAY